MNPNLMMLILQIKDETYDIETHWIALYVQNNDVTYFNSFGVEHTFQKKRKYFLKIKN